MPDPTSPPLRRLFALRQFATFASVDLAELAVVADNVVETQFAAGEEIAPADARLRALHLVIRGGIEARHDGGIETWGPRDVFGMLEVLADRSISAPAISVTDTQTLALGAADTHEILEDNFGVLHAVIRGLAGRLAATGGVPASQALELPPTGLTLVERVIVLRQHAPFAGGRLQALAAVAQNCEELVWPAGTRIARTGQSVDHVAIVLDGTVRANHEHRGLQILRAGQAIGALEGLAGIRHESELETATAVRVLRWPTAALLDVLEDHTDLGLAMVINFARLLLDAPRARALEHDLHSHLS